MASLKKRGRVWWIRYRAGKKLVEKSLKTRKKFEAQYALKEVGGREVRGELALPSRSPVGEFLEKYASRLRLRSTNKAWKIDSGRLKIFFERARVRTLEQVTPDLISRILEEGLEGGWSPKTFNNYREIVHRLFSYAIRERGFVSPMLGRTNPASFVRRVALPPPKIRHLRLNEIEELLEHLGGTPRMQTAVATLIYTGLRRAELLWLTVDDIDLSTRLVTIRGKTVGTESWHPKTRKNRGVPVSDSLLPYLERQLTMNCDMNSGMNADMNDAMIGDMTSDMTGDMTSDMTGDMTSNMTSDMKTDSPWLFPSATGSRWDLDNFSRALRQAQEPCPVRWSCLDFRHTFASHLAKKGVSIFKIAKLLGNTAPICERHYAHLSPAGLAEEVEFHTDDTPPRSPDTDYRRVYEARTGREAWIRRGESRRSFGVVRRAWRRRCKSRALSAAEEKVSTPRY